MNTILSSIRNQLKKNKRAVRERWWAEHGSERDTLQSCSLYRGLSAQNENKMTSARKNIGRAQEELPSRYWCTCRRKKNFTRRVAIFLLWCTMQFFVLSVLRHARSGQKCQEWPCKASTRCQRLANLRQSQRPAKLSIIRTRFVFILFQRIDRRPRTW